MVHDTTPTLTTTQGGNSAEPLRLHCPVIRTGDLLLRPPHLDDAEDMARLANNYSVANMLGSMPHPYFEADAREFISKAQESATGQCVYAVTLVATGEFMGCCGLHEDASRFEFPFIGYWLGEPYWGRGFATQATRAMVDLFFKVTDRDCLMISCRTDNPGSRRVIKKCGGVYWKPGRQYNKALGEWHSLENYRIDRENWLAATAN